MHSTNYQLDSPCSGYSSISGYTGRQFSLQVYSGVFSVGVALYSAGLGLCSAEGCMVQYNSDSMPWKLVMITVHSGNNSAWWY